MPYILIANCIFSKVQQLEQKVKAQEKKISTLENTIKGIDYKAAFVFYPFINAIFIYFFFRDFTLIERFVGKLRRLRIHGSLSGIKLVVSS